MTITSVGVMLSISDVLVKHDLFRCFESWFNDATFPTYTDWKRIVKYKIQVFEEDTLSQFCNSHPDMHVAQSCFENMSVKQFWSTDHFLHDCPYFMKGLNRQHKITLLVGGLSLSFDHETTTLIKRFISSAVGKIYKLRTKKLCKLEAPWLAS